MSNIENLINNKLFLFEDVMPTRKDNCQIPCGGLAKEMQRAKKNASLYDFIDMVAQITDYVLKDYNVLFLTEEQQNIIKDPEISVERPYITYKIINRKPKNEYKPIVREEIIEHDEYNNQRIGNVYGQKFDCIIQFNIMANENRLASQIMEAFEELMISYAGYFKQEGVVDLYFKEQITDTEYDNFRESLSIRNLRYYVEIEKLMVIFNHKITDVLISGEIKKNNNK